MRWRNEEPRVPAGDEFRTVLRFAWVPTKVGAVTVWLERFEVRERYFQPRSGAQGWWSEIGRWTLGGAR